METFTFDSLVIMNIVYNNIISSNTWQHIDPKDIKILALTIEINQLKQENNSVMSAMVQYRPLSQYFKL